jgi:outer membrane protein OmpA-like peptidoglycan-associated protein
MKQLVAILLAVLTYVPTWASSDTLYVSGDTVVIRRILGVHEAPRTADGTVVTDTVKGTLRSTRYAYEERDLVDTVNFSDRQRFGLFLQALPVYHTASFGQLPNVPACCPEYNDAWGLHWELGVSGLWAIGATPGSIALHVGYGLSRVSLEDREATTFLRPTPVPGEILHTLTSSFASINFTPLYRYHLGKGLHVGAGAAFRVLLSTSFDQREEIVTPRGAVFTDSRSALRNQRNGSITSAESITVAPTLSVSYDLPLTQTRSIVATPSLGYQLLLPGYVSSTRWTSHSIVAGIAIGFNTEKIGRRDGTQETRTIITRPLPGQTPESIIADREPTIRIRLTDPQTTPGETASRSSDTLRAERVMQAVIQPLLPYVFFDEGSSVIPERYALQGDPSYGRGGRIDDEVLTNYYNLLNIVAERLYTYPDATITLTGCTTNEGVEQDNVALGRARAAAVKTYLTTVHGIAADRILLAGRTLPEMPSTQTGDDAEDGKAENRRVEISSDTWQITQWIEDRDTVDAVTPEEIYVQTGIRSAGITKRKVEVSVDGNVLVSLSDSLQGGVTRVDLTKYARIIASGRTLTARVTYLMADGRSFTASDAMVVAADPRTRRYERIVANLILFPFGQSEVSGMNSRVMSYINGLVDSRYRATVEGHTDRVGTEQANLAISQARAQRAASALSITAGSITGVGEAQPLHTNDVPEGRMYNRTVQFDFTARKNK